MGTAAIEKERALAAKTMKEEMDLDRTLFENSIKYLKPTRITKREPDYCMINPNEYLRSELLNELPMLTNHGFQDLCK